MSTSRHPRGTADGGKFAPGARGRSVVELDDDHLSLGDDGTINDAPANPHALTDGRSDPGIEIEGGALWVGPWEVTTLEADDRGVSAIVASHGDTADWNRHLEVVIDSTGTVQLFEDEGGEMIGEVYFDPASSNGVNEARAFLVEQ